VHQPQLKNFLKEYSTMAKALITKITLTVLFFSCVAIFYVVDPAAIAGLKSDSFLRRLRGGVANDGEGPDCTEDDPEDCVTESDDDEDRRLQSDRQKRKAFCESHLPNGDKDAIKKCIKDCKKGGDIYNGRNCLARLLRGPSLEDDEGNDCQEENPDDCDDDEDRRLQSNRQKRKAFCESHLPSGDKDAIKKCIKDCKKGGDIYNGRNCLARLLRGPSLEDDEGDDCQEDDPDDCVTESDDDEDRRLGRAARQRRREFCRTTFPGGDQDRCRKKCKRNNDVYVYDDGTSQPCEIRAGNSQASGGNAR